MGEPEDLTISRTSQNSQTTPISQLGQKNNFNLHNTIDTRLGGENLIVSEEIQNLSEPLLTNSTTQIDIHKPIEYPVHQNVLPNQTDPISQASSSILNVNAKDNKKSVEVTNEDAKILYVKEIQNRIDELENTINELESKVEDLVKRNDSLRREASFMSDRKDKAERYKSNYPSEVIEGWGKKSEELYDEYEKNKTTIEEYDDRLDLLDDEIKYMKKLKNEKMKELQNPENIDTGEPKSKPKIELGKPKSTYKKVQLSSGDIGSKFHMITVTKTDQKGNEIIKKYIFTQELGKGMAGTVYLYTRVDDQGNIIPGKAKVLKMANDKEGADDIKSGVEIMKDQYVDQMGSPRRTIPGLMKRVKYRDPVHNFAMSSFYDLGDVNVKPNSSPKKPADCFDFVAQTCFGIYHMHSRYKWEKNRLKLEKKSLVHGDLKLQNVICRINPKTGSKEYGITDFDGVAKAVDGSITASARNVNLTDALLINLGKLKHLNEGEIENFNKARDVRALGLMWSAFILQNKPPMPIGEINKIDGMILNGEKIDLNEISNEDKNEIQDLLSSGYHDLPGPIIRMSDFPGEYIDSLNEQDKEKMEKLVSLINRMTATDWRKRPSIDSCFFELTNMGIKTPWYS